MTTLALCLFLTIQPSFGYLATKHTPTQFKCVKTADLDSVRRFVGVEWDGVYYENDTVYVEVKLIKNGKFKTIRR